MRSGYYKVLDDLDIPGRWHLDDGVWDADGDEVDPSDFLGQGESLQLRAPLRIGVSHPGRPLQWTFGSFEMPVLAAKVGHALLDLAPDAVELHPARVDGHPEPFVALNILACRACLDEARSKFIKWAAADGRPDRMGWYRQVSRLRIDAGRTGAAPILRVAGWPVALVSAEAKGLLERLGTTGIRFVRVD